MKLRNKAVGKVFVIALAIFSIQSAEMLQSIISEKILWKKK